MKWITSNKLETEVYIRGVNANALTRKKMKRNRKMSANSLQANALYALKYGAVEVPSYRPMGLYFTITFKSDF